MKCVGVVQDFCVSVSSGFDIWYPKCSSGFFSSGYSYSDLKFLGFDLRFSFYAQSKLHLKQPHQIPSNEALNQASNPHLKIETPGNLYSQN
jgi:hypothetical protein